MNQLRYFLEMFTEPGDWYESRKVFSYSVALWSVIGYVVGLGDRHPENILIDTNNGIYIFYASEDTCISAHALLLDLGECVHVDFDCLFDKGLGLARPEIVPFRLTPNIVDALGSYSYESFN